MVERKTELRVAQSWPRPLTPSPLNRVQARATARVARALGEVMRRVWRRVSSVADLIRPALLRVDLRDGVALPEISSAGPPLLFERLERLRCAVPSPLTPAVAAPTVRSMPRAFGFFDFAWLLLTCSSARYRSALVAVSSRITVWVRECTRCLARGLSTRRR